MRKEQKGELINAISEQISAKAHLYITDITGLNAESTSRLRRLCFRRNVKLVVVKNTLLKKALENAGDTYSELFPVLKGTSAIMLSDVNNEPAKLIKEFRASAEKPILKGAYVEESVYIGNDQLDILIHIKSKNELLGDIVSALQSPVRQVLGALQTGQNTIGGLVKTLSEREAQ